MISWLTVTDDPFVVVAHSPSFPFRYLTRLTPADATSETPIPSGAHAFVPGF